MKKMNNNFFSLHLSVRVMNVWICGVLFVWGYFHGGVCFGFLFFFNLNLIFFSLLSLFFPGKIIGMIGGMHCTLPEAESVLEVLWLL